MKWKTKRDTIIVQNKLAEIPFVTDGVGLPGGERFERAGEYVETAADGRILARYGEPRSFSIDDELIVSDIHLVIGDRLYKFYWSQFYRCEPVVRFEQLFEGLTMIGS